jgi:hypothetical protein
VLKRSDIPPWTGDDEWMQAFVNAELDKADYEFHRDLAAATNSWLRSLPPRSKAESLKRHLTIGKRAAAKYRELLEQRAIEEGDIEALRQLHPKLVRFLNLPPQRGRPKKIGHDPWSKQNRLADAIAELPRIRAIWKKNYDRSNRPSGAITAEKITAERWGLTEDDVKKRRVQ